MHPVQYELSSRLFVLIQDILIPYPILEMRSKLAYVTDNLSYVIFQLFQPILVFSLRMSVPQIIKFTFNLSEFLFEFLPYLQEAEVTWGGEKVRTGFINTEGFTGNGRSGSRGGRRGHGGRRG